MMRDSLVLLLAVLLLTASTGAYTQLDVLASRPPYARLLHKDIVGISIELPIFLEFAGTTPGSPNPFVQQALSNLKNLTGLAVPVRVGGSPEDVTFLSQQVGIINATYPPARNSTPYPPASQVLISEDFYALSGNFPPGTPFTWGLNLAALNQSETVMQAMALFDAFYGSKRTYTQHVKLARLEIGNEADLFGQGFSPVPGIYIPPKIPGFDINVYSRLQQGLIGAISKAVRLGPSGPGFQVGSFADAVGLQPFMYTAINLFGTGLLQSNISRYISTYSRHHYMAVSTGNPATNPSPGWLLNKETIRSNCSLSAFDAQVAQSSGLDYELGETNSASNHGIYGSSDTAEAAIWQVDYVLQQATVGANRLYFHNGNGYAYNMMQPVALANGPAATPKPVLKGIYFGTYMINEFIGASKKPYITELTTNSTNVSAYGLFDEEKIKRVMIINFNTFFPGDLNRTSEVVAMSGLNVNSGTLKRFYTPYTNSTSGLNWAGVSFDDDARPTGTPFLAKLTGNSVSLNASEVVMVSFD